MPGNDVYITNDQAYDDYEYIGDEDEEIEPSEEPDDEGIDEESIDSEEEDVAEENADSEEEDDAAEDNDEDDSDLDEVVQHTEEVAQMLGKHGIDYNSVVDEFQTSGKLSPATMEKLTKAGYTPGIIKSYINGQEARYDKYRTKVEKTVGGDKRYTELQNWAKDNLTPKEKRAYNAAVESGDLAKARFAVKGLQARYEAHEGREAKLVKGKSTVAARAKGYANMEEYSKATDDPRYYRDKAYTAKVNARILATDFIS